MHLFLHIIYRILCFKAGAVPGCVGDVGDLEIFLWKMWKAGVWPPLRHMDSPLLWLNEVVTLLMRSFVDIFGGAYFLFNNWAYKFFWKNKGGFKCLEESPYSYKAIPFPIWISTHLYNFVSNLVLYHILNDFCKFEVIFMIIWQTGMCEPLKRHGSVPTLFISQN